MNPIQSIPTGRITFFITSKSMKTENAQRVKPLPKNLTVRP